MAEKPKFAREQRRDGKSLSGCQSEPSAAQVRGGCARDRPSHQHSHLAGEFPEPGWRFNVCSAVCKGCPQKINHSPWAGLSEASPMIVATTGLKAAPTESSSSSSSSLVTTTINNTTTTTTTPPPPTTQDACCHQCNRRRTRRPSSCRIVWTSLTAVQTNHHHHSHRDPQPHPDPDCKRH